MMGTWGTRRAMAGRNNWGWDKRKRAEWVEGLVCVQCGKTFRRLARTVRQSPAKYCSKPCFGLACRIDPAKKKATQRRLAYEWADRNRDKIRARANERTRNPPEHLAVRLDCFHCGASFLRLHRDAGRCARSFCSSKCFGADKKVPEEELKRRHAVVDKAYRAANRDKIRLQKSSDRYGEEYAVAHVALRDLEIELKEIEES